MIGKSCRTEPLNGDLVALPVASTLPVAFVLFFTFVARIAGGVIGTCEPIAMSISAVGGVADGRSRIELASVNGTGEPSGVGDVAVVCGG